MLDYLASIAAALLGTKVYCVDTSAIPERLRLPNALAMTGRTLDLLIRDQLKELGQWCGRHPAIAFESQAIRQYAAKYVSEFDGDLTKAERQNFNAAMIHELAHIAQNGIDTSEPTAESEQFAEGMARASVAMSRLTQSGRDVTHITGDRHGMMFCRMACHVWHRARRLGADCPLSLVLDDRLPALDSALLNEPESLSANRFSLFEIANDIQTPRAFRELWGETQ